MVTQSSGFLDCKSPLCPWPNLWVLGREGASQRDRGWLAVGIRGQEHLGRELEFEHTGSTGRGITESQDWRTRSVPDKEFSRAQGPRRGQKINLKNQLRSDHRGTTESDLTL